MPFYECVFIARQDLSGQQAESLADQFTKVIEEQGGTVAQREYWGLRSLSYRIRKNRKGHYILLNVDGPPAALQELDRQMRINEDVIRHLTVRVDELKAGPSMILQNRGAREDRPRRDDRGPRGDRPFREDRPYRGDGPREDRPYRGESAGRGGDRDGERGFGDVGASAESPGD